MWECSSFNILTRETHMNTLFKQWPKSHSLTKSPIGSTCFDHIHAGFQNTSDTFVDFELSCVWRWWAESLSDVNKGFFKYTGRWRLNKINYIKTAKYKWNSNTYTHVCTYIQGILSFEESRPRRIQPILVFNVGFLFGLIISVFANLFIFLAHILYFFSVDSSFFDQLISIYVQY